MCSAEIYKNTSFQVWSNIFNHYITANACDRPFSRGKCVPNGLCWRCLQPLFPSFHSNQSPVLLGWWGETFLCPPSFSWRGGDSTKTPHSQSLLLYSCLCSRVSDPLVLILLFWLLFSYAHDSSCRMCSIIRQVGHPTIAWNKVIFDDTHTFLNINDEET